MGFLGTFSSLFFDLPPRTHRNRSSSKKREIEVEKKERVEEPDTSVEEPIGYPVWAPCISSETPKSTAVVSSSVAYRLGIRGPTRVRVTNAVSGKSVDVEITRIDENSAGVHMNHEDFDAMRGENCPGRTLYKTEARILGTFTR